MTRSTGCLNTVNKRPLCPGEKILFDSPIQGVTIQSANPLSASPSSTHLSIPGRVVGSTFTKGLGSWSTGTPPGLTTEISVSWSCPSTIPYSEAIVNLWHVPIISFTVDPPALGICQNTGWSEGSIGSQLSLYPSSTGFTTAPNMSPGVGASPSAGGGIDPSEGGPARGSPSFSPLPPPFKAHFSSSILSCSCDTANPPWLYKSFAEPLTIWSNVGCCCCAGLIYPPCCCNCSCWSCSGVIWIAIFCWPLHPDIACIGWGAITAGLVLV